MMGTGIPAQPLPSLPSAKGKFGKGFGWQSPGARGSPGSVPVGETPEEHRRRKEGPVPLRKRGQCYLFAEFCFH